MADQLYQAVWSFNNAGQFSQNVQCWKFDDAGYASTHAAAAALAAALDGSRKSLLMNILPSSTTLLTIKARRVTGGGGLEAVELITSGATGGRGGIASTSGVAPVIIGYQALPTNRKRARQFLCGVSDLDLVNGIYTSSFKTAVAGALGTLFDPITLSGGGAPVATFVLKATTAGLAEVIATWRLSDMPGQLRRRQLPV